MVSASCIDAVLRTGLVVAVLLTWWAPVDAQERVYLTEEEALSRALRDAEQVGRRTVALSPEQAEALRNDTGAQLIDTAYVFHQAMNGSRVERSAVVVNVMGQYQPITMYVAIGAGGGVERVEIMAYRESRGGEVRRKAFLEQFEGKSFDDPLRTGGDIMHITGATISSRAVSRGVRLALRLYQLLDADS